MSEFQIDVKYDGLKRFFARARSFNDVHEGIREGASIFMKELARYPNERHGPAIWSNDPEKRVKQIRGFFARLRNGEIRVPYPRSGSQGKAWTLYMRDSGVTWIIRNPDPSVFFTRGRNQTRYHKLSKWEQPPQLWKRVQSSVKAAIARGINKFIRKD